MKRRWVTVAVHRDAVRINEHLGEGLAWTWRWSLADVHWNGWLIRYVDQRTFFEVLKPEAEKNDGAADQIGKTKGEADFFFLSFFCGCCVLVIRRGVFPLQLLVFCEEQVQNQWFSVFPRSWAKIKQASRTVVFKSSRSENHPGSFPSWLGFWFNWSWVGPRHRKLWKAP